MSFRAALNVEEDEAEIMKRNGNETGVQRKGKQQVVSDHFGFFHGED